MGKSGNNVASHLWFMGCPLGKGSRGLWGPPRPMLCIPRKGGIIPSHGGLHGGGPWRDVLRFWTGPVILSGFPNWGLLPDGWVPVSQGVLVPPTLAGCMIGVLLQTGGALGDWIIATSGGWTAIEVLPPGNSLVCTELVASVCAETVASTTENISYISTTGNISYISYTIFFCTIITCPENNM